MHNLKKNLLAMDYKILVAVIVLTALGIIALYSSTVHTNSDQLKGNFIRQIVWLLIASFFLILILFLPQRVFQPISYMAYLLSILTLILVLLVGLGHGSTRWLTLGALRFQPSEFAKIATLMALARFLSEQEQKAINQFRQIIVSFVIVLIPAILIIQQPDLGTSMVFLGIILPILYWAGLSPFIIFVLVAPFFSLVAAFQLGTFFLTMIIIVAVLLLSRRSFKVFIFNFILNVSVGIFTPYLWNNLYSYQQKRILTFLGLEIDPRGIGYQLIQSKVAIGSGGIWGKGLLKGTQTQLRFLPAQHTDFILSVIGEELGFIGIFIVLSLFLFILIRGIRIAATTRNRYASILTLGGVCVLAFHIIVNVGMTVGIMPVTGLPLPFLSYGGSFLLTSYILIGLILNTSLHKFLV